MNKKTIYLIASMILFLLIGYVISAGLELRYMNGLLKSGADLSLLENTKSGWLTLTIILSLLGLISGYFVGQKWWQIIYVEKRHWKYKFCKK